MEEVIKKLQEHDKQLDTIARTVVEHTEQFDRIEENMATKEDTDKISSTLDELVIIAKKKDQELTFMGEQVKRVEEDVQKVKPLVGLT